MAGRKRVCPASVRGLLTNSNLTKSAIEKNPETLQTKTTRLCHHECFHNQNFPLTMGKFSQAQILLQVEDS